MDNRLQSQVKQLSGLNALFMIVIAVLIPQNIFSALLNG